MVKLISRGCAAGTAALALSLLGGGVASAAEQAPQAPQEQPAVWALPGVDTGALLGPTTQLPAQALAPVDGVLTALGG